MTVRVGTVLSWQTKTGYRFAKVVSITDHLLFLRDTAGKPIEFKPSGLLELIEDGVIAMVRRRTKTGKRWRLLKITWLGCKLRCIRKRAIAAGMRLLSEDEITAASYASTRSMVSFQRLNRLWS